MVVQLSTVVMGSDNENNVFHEPDTSKNEHEVENFEPLPVSRCASPSEWTTINVSEKGEDESKHVEFSDEVEITPIVRNDEYSEETSNNNSDTGCNNNSNHAENDDSCAVVDEVSQNDGVANEPSSKPIIMEKVNKENKKGLRGLCKRFQAMPKWVSASETDQVLGSTRSLSSKERKPVPLKRRPNSALGITTNREIRSMTHRVPSAGSRDELLSSYVRSLKLLGLEPQEFGISKQEEEKTKMARRLVQSK